MGSLRGMPWGVGLFLAYALLLLAGIGLSLGFVVDQAENCFPMIPSGAAHNEMLLGDAAESIEDAITEEGKMLV